MFEIHVVLIADKNIAEIRNLKGFEFQIFSGKIIKFHISEPLKYLEFVWFWISGAF